MTLVTRSVTLKNMNGLIKRSTLVGTFIKNRREMLGLSQRSLGQMLLPAVTTQFISNVERGVTPLPTCHIPALSKALSIKDSEILTLLEREYAIKIGEKIGYIRSEDQLVSEENPKLVVQKQDYSFIRELYEAFQLANPMIQQKFMATCEELLEMRSAKKSS